MRRYYPIPKATTCIVGLSISWNCIRCSNPRAAEKKIWILPMFPNLILDRKESRKSGYYANVAICLGDATVTNVIQNPKTRRTTGIAFSRISLLKDCSCVDGGSAKVPF